MTENQMTRRVPFAMPDIGSAEIDAVTSVLRSGWLTTGEQCAQFEREFAQAVGASHAVAVNSCTAAMHLSLEALDVQPGDLVFTSPYTFASTAEVVRYLGATPVFVDIDPVTLNIDPTALREAVTASLSAGRGRPRAIIPVHIAGLPCAMDEIWALARDTGLAVVEDAAHAFPSAHGSGKVGTIPADVEGTACFSFYATKTMTTGEGGMLVTERAEVADRARMMSLHGLSRQAWSRYAEGGHWAYDIAALGFKYNLSDIAAAMGRVQLARSDEMTRRRGEVAAAYTAALSSVPGIAVSGDPDRRQPFMAPVRHPARRRRRDVSRCLHRRSGIAGHRHVSPLHPAPPAQQLRRDVRVRRRGLSPRACGVGAGRVPAHLQRDGGC